MKAILSNRIYVDYDVDLYRVVKDKYTFTIPSKIPGGRPTILRMYNTIGNVLSLPIGCASSIPENFTIKDIRVTSPVEFPEFQFELRPDQKEIYDAVEDSCLINANPSWGKTFTAIAIATKLAQKTLVICHNTMLRDQWEVEIKKTLGITPGVIGSGKYNIDAPIVVSNIQTLRNHATKLASEFGTIIVDEVHRAPAKIFSNTLNTLKARYKIGLSATLERKDGIHVTLPLYFSDKLYVASRANQMKPEVHIYKTSIKIPGNSQTPWAHRLNDLYENPDWLKLVRETSQAYAARGYKVLVVADRVDFLNLLEEIDDNVVTITGSTKDRNEKLLQVREVGTDIVAGTTSIFKEGISENCLSCLVIAVPLNNEPVLEQLVGRIQRKQEGKKQPIVVDILCAGGTGRTQGYTRAAHYKKKGYKTTLIDVQ